MRRDANEAAIVDELRKAGCIVYRLHEPVDLLVVADGKPWLLEVKGPKGLLTDGQMRFFMCCPQNTAVVVTPNDAFRVLGIAAGGGNE
jgi:hypothetical protein